MRKQPLDFRKEEVTYVMQRWLARESCSLAGVGSVGKSNLLQHLSDPDVQKHYMSSTNSQQFKAILIDPNLLGPLSSAQDSEQFRCWAGYELLMHRLFLAFYPFDILDDEDTERFYETYQALQDGSNPLYAYMGLRYFELGLEFFMRRGIQIVFMFDEFEEMLQNLPVKFFQTLRGLRDNHKRQLSYLTFTRAPLPVIVERKGIDVLGIEPFTELFTDNLLYVGPYNDKDGRAMLDRLIKRNQEADYPDYVANFLLYASGGYAGLLRASFRMVPTLGEITSSDVYNNSEFLINKLASRRAVRSECQTIWSSLTPAEQVVLKAVANLSTYERNTTTEQAIAMLVQKRLLRVDKERGELHIEPPVFRAFVISNPDVEE